MIQRVIGGVLVGVLGVSVGGCARDDVRTEQPRSGPGEAAPPTAATPDAPAHSPPGAGGTMKIASRDTITYTPQIVGPADGSRWVGYAPNELKVFAGDTEQAKVTASLTPPVGELRLSADGKTIYAAPVKVDLATGKVSPDADTLATWFTAGAKETAAGDHYEAAASSWSPDGQHVAIALRTRRARNEPRGQAGAASGPQRRLLVLDAGGKLVADLVHPGLAVVRSVAVANDAVVAGGGGVIASALPTAKLVELLPPDASANLVGFAGGGRFVVASTSTETRVWATGSWTPVAALPVSGALLAGHPSKAIVAIAPAPPGLSPDIVELWAFDGEPRKLGTVDAAKASGIWLGADDTLYIKRAAQPGVELVRLALP